jgi:mono/diheme cytochrome c family protein
MKLRFLLCSLLLLLGTTAVRAADPAQGKHLVEQHCTRCHGSEPFTRPDRRVSSLQALQKQVRMCQGAQDLDWQDEQIDDVVAYLNDNFYHFQ